MQDSDIAVGWDEPVDEPAIVRWTWWSAAGLAGGRSSLPAAWADAVTGDPDAT